MLQCEQDLFKFIETCLPDCYEIQAKVHHDNRGTFTKVFHAESFHKFGISCSFKEIFYSHSYKNVLRGLHFQSPPMEQDKLVYCINGKALDAVVDIRIDSATYGMFCLTELDADKGNMLYIPAGMAHGFLALTDMIMAYNVTSIHDVKHDCGILWDSVGIPWPCREPILSERDKNFPTFGDFVSPFVK